MGRMEGLFYELYASSKRHDSWQRQAMIRELRNLLKQPLSMKMKGNRSDSMVNKIGIPEDQVLDDGELVETEVATEPIPQIQVPISKLERGLQIHNVSPTVCEDSQYVVGCDELFGHQEAMLQVSHVKVRDELLTKSTDVTSNQAAHYLFDKMSLRVQSKRRHLKCHKSWMFKFKQRKQHRGKPRTAHKLMNRENVMEDYHVYQEGLPLWLLVRFKFWKFKFINRKLQKMMREHGYSSHLKLKSDVGEDDEMFTGAKAVSMRFLLGIMLGITESDAGQGQQAEFEQVVMTNVWLQTSLVTQQVMRSKKIKFPKRWMFKYKYVEEDIKSLHNLLSYMSRLELEERFKSWSQRETVEAKQNLKNWYDDSLLEFLKRIEAGSSMIMILYNNTELINYLYHLEKSCLVSIIRIENALIEARFVKTMEEYSKNHLASTLAYELFHSPRPPELFVADRMIATKEETEEVMKESDHKQQGEWSHYFLLVAAANWSPQMNLWSTSYRVWHRWKARYCFVGIISTMWAWLFGEEGFDTVKRSIKNRTRGRGRLEAINGPGSNKTKNKRRQKLFILSIESFCEFWSS